jgi:hypothetical protein
MALAAATLERRTGNEYLPAWSSIDTGTEIFFMTYLAKVLAGCKQRWQDGIQGSYSSRKATTGSTRAARCAGTMHAVSATITNDAAVPA